jgi:hypothetical protein
MKTSCCHSKSIRQEEDYALCMNEDCDNFMRPTQIVHRSGIWNNTFAFFFFVFFFILTFNDYSYNNSGGLTNVDSNIFRQNRPLTEATLRSELDSNNILCPEQVFAQIMIESAHLNSYLAKRTNNLLGMRFPFKRKTTAIGIYLPETNQIIKGSQAELMKYHNKNHYAVYANWQDCVKDYKHWQDQSFKLTERYLLFLGTYYAEDTKYVEKIKKLSK